jgi:hypothetical protein
MQPQVAVERHRQERWATEPPAAPVVTRSVTPYAANFVKSLWPASALGVTMWVRGVETHESFELGDAISWWRRPGNVGFPG